jgi:flavin-binding protein dodecin
LIDGIRHINIGNVFLVNNSYGFDLSTSSGATINGMSVYGNISLGSVSGSVWDNAARDSVKVWASNDNVNWSEVEQFDAPPIIKGLGLGNWGFTLTLSTPQTNYRYYKISNAESDYLTISSNQINPGEIEVF